ncbi:MAG: uncharacterized protein A8A55_2107 [Amphiamblys sp. WSBS2006]|nr:MAG: uncharacterized protein A8A55_2107 [Amphiamblys sp. WSBS2006]
MENLREQTVFLQKMSVGRYENRYFLERNEGLLVVPNTRLYEHPREIRAEEESLFILRQEVLRASGRSDDDAKCMVCCEGSSEELFLFPTSREAHDGRDTFAMTEYKRILSERQEEFLNYLTAQLTTHTPSEFLPTTTNIPNRPTLLTEQTKVSLENIAISEALFFVLLSKTKVRVGENFSLFGEENDGDSIAEHGIARYAPALLRKKEQSEAITPLFLDNVSNIPSNSIGCTLGKDLVNISTWLLPKMKTSDLGMCESLSLNEKVEEYISPIFGMDDRSIFIGKVKEIDLADYAVNVLPKLKFHEDNEINVLDLSAEREEHIAPILAREQRFCLGRIKGMGLGEYAVFILVKMDMTRICPETLVLSNDIFYRSEIFGAYENNIFLGGVGKLGFDGYALDLLAKLKRRKEDNVIKGLYLNADEADNIAKTLREADRSIDIGEVGTMRLEGYSVDVLPKLVAGVFKKIELVTREEDHVSNILNTGNRSIDIGKVGTMELHDYAVNLLPKLVVENVEELVLFAHKESYISNILEAGNRSIDIGGVKKLELCTYARSVLPKLKMGENNEMERFSMWIYGGKGMASILSMGDGSIEIGRIKQKGFWVPEEIKPKLKYILVDEEGHEIETS